MNSASLQNNTETPISQHQEDCLSGSVEDSLDSLCSVTNKGPVWGAWGHVFLDMVKIREPSHHHHIALFLCVCVYFFLPLEALRSFGGGQNNRA